MRQCSVTDPSRQRPEPYALPVDLERGAAPRFVVRNVGDERIDWVDVTISGPGVMVAHRPRGLDPGEGVAVTVFSRDLERSCVLQVSWFRPAGGVYLWTFGL